MEITIKSQSEFDALPAKFDEYTRVYIQATDRIVVARKIGNSSVVARGNSSVVARENSSVEARENSSVVAWENSSVEARENVGVHLFSDYAHIALFAFAVCWKLAKGKIEKNAKTVTVITPKPSDWFDENAIKKTANVILFKRVSHDLKTQENTQNETLWEIGSTVEHPAWSPKEQECGTGKFHACSRAYFCDEFRSTKGDRYIAIEVARKHTFAWENPIYPHKIAFRKCKVLHEVNRLGKKI